MAKRYIPNHPTATTCDGYNMTFSPDRVGLDGSVGYSWDEVKPLGKAMIKAHFRVVDFSGDGVIEAATAAPGQKRAVSKPKPKVAS